ncbi:3',5'-cyclic adenosine monophosphate phosphodiesterase CpdA [Actinomadura cremea]|nr:3',5'-cyclic adenosine monophosphate phosphodiesterase CpdA [Actinomadura cremea]
MTVLAQLSDLHLDGGEHRLERARRVMARLNAMPLDAVLVTGDIADHGDPAEYAQAREVLESPHPVLMCPGNHDAREPYRKVLLGETPTAAPIDRVERVAGVLFAMCDSTVPGEDRGSLSEGTLGWLDRVLGEERSGPAIVCLHHPPVPLGIPYVDEIRLFGEEGLAELLARHPRVVAVLTGHAHTPAATTFAGRPLVVAPGVVSTLRLPAEAAEVIDPAAPPGAALHVLDGGRLTTHFRTF